MTLPPTWPKDCTTSALLITVGASLLLLLRMRVVSTVAATANPGALGVDHLRDRRMQPVADAAGAAAGVVLAVAILLSVFNLSGGIHSHSE